MITAAIVRELMLAGLEGEALLAALERIEKASAPVRTARQERNRRYYETHREELRERRLKASETSETTEFKTLQDVSDVEEPLPPSSPLPSPQTPNPTPLYPPTPQNQEDARELFGEVIPLEPKSRKKPARPIPSDFTFPPNALAILFDAGFSQAEALEEVEKFKDHHHARGNLFSDHAAAARTWARNAVRYREAEAARPSLGRNRPASPTDFGAHQLVARQISQGGWANDGADPDEFLF